VDYILSSSITMRTVTNADITYKLSDHALVCTHVPISCHTCYSSAFTHFDLHSDIFRGAADTKHTPPPPHIPHATHDDTTCNHTPPTTMHHTKNEADAAQAGIRQQPHATN
jgi:hypothetical protein